MGQPAARVTDTTAHGTPLSPGPGAMTVLIGGLPANKPPFLVTSQVTEIELLRSAMRAGARDVRADELESSLDERGGERRDQGPARLPNDRRAPDSRASRWSQNDAIASLTRPVRGDGMAGKGPPRIPPSKGGALPVSKEVVARKREGRAARRPA